MEVPGLAHSISSPLSPCEGMIKDLSLDALQLCERDGKRGSAALHYCVDTSGSILSPSRCNARTECVLALRCMMQGTGAGGSSGCSGGMSERLYSGNDVLFLHERRFIPEHNVER